MMTARAFVLRGAILIKASRCVSQPADEDHEIDVRELGVIEQLRAHPITVADD